MVAVWKNHYKMAANLKWNKMEQVRGRERVYTDRGPFYIDKLQMKRENFIPEGNFPEFYFKMKRCMNVSKKDKTHFYSSIIFNYFISNLNSLLPCLLY